MSDSGSSHASSDANSPTVLGDSPSQPSTADISALPFIDGFEVLGRLGQGGMGIVHKARDRKLDRLVAIKTLRTGTDATEAELNRFQKEAKVIAQLKHPHIVQVYEVGESSGLVYLILEYMNGGALASFLDGSPLEPRIAAQIMVTLSDAAAEAHKMGIVHRDLKPGNVLVALPDALISANARRDVQLLQLPNVTLKLADFGLAKSLSNDDAQTMSGQVMGTPRYAAPELVRGEVRMISPATDVYSLGAILYELLTGTSVFRAIGFVDLLDAIREQDPLSPRTLQLMLDRDLETICLKCLQKSSKDRYETASALSDELNRWLQHQPIHARPAGVIERTIKWVRRNPFATAFGGICTLAMLVTMALIVSVSYQSRLTKANTELEVARDSALQAQAEAARQRDLLARHRYAADMVSAGRAWTEGDIARAEARVLRNVPDASSADSPDLRGFEWRYLSGLLKSDAGRLNGSSAAYSNDGRLLAAAQENAVTLVDPDTRSLIRTFEGSEMSTYRIAFSLDGRRLIGSCRDHKFRVWDVASGKLVQTFEKHSWLGRVSLSPDGSMALTTGGFEDRSVKLWRVNTGEVLLDLHAPNGYPGGIEFSPDGEWFAVGWPLTNSVRIGRINQPNAYVEVSVANLSDLRADLEQPTVCFHPSSKWLYVSNGDQIGQIPLTDLSKDSVVALTGMSGVLLDTNLTGKHLAAGREVDNTLLIWDTESKELLNQRKGHVGGYGTFSFRGDTGIGVSAGNDGLLRFCGALDFQEYRALNQKFPVADLITFNNTGTVMAFHHFGSGVVLFDGVSFQNLSPTLQAAVEIDFSPDGKLVAATSPYMHKTCVWQVPNGELFDEIEHPHAVSVLCLTFDLAGERLLIGGDNGYLGAWDRKSKQFSRLPDVGNERISKLTIRPKIGEIFAATYDKVFELNRGADSSPESLTPANLEFTPDGTGYFALGERLRTELHLIDLETRQVLQTFSGHQAALKDAIITSDGSRIATFAEDKTVKLWDTASGQETLSISAGDFITAIAFTPDDRQIVVGLYAGEIRFYDSSPGYQTVPE